MVPQVAYKAQTKKRGEHHFCCVEPNCASPLQTGGGAVVCGLEFPGLFATPREMFATAVICYVLLILIAFQNVKTTVIFGRDRRAALISSVLQQI